MHTNQSSPLLTASKAHKHSEKLMSSWRNRAIVQYSQRKPSLFILSKTRTFIYYDIKSSRPSFRGKTRNWRNDPASQGSKQRNKCEQLNLDLLWSFVRWLTTHLSSKLKMRSEMANFSAIHSSFSIFFFSEAFEKRILNNIPCYRVSRYLIVWCFYRCCAVPAELQHFHHCSVATLSFTTA